MELEPRERTEDGKLLPRKLTKIRAERFREHLLATRSAQTTYSYMQAVQRFDNFLDKCGVLLRTASVGILDDFVISLAKLNLSPATIALTISGVRSYTEWCRNHEEGGCPHLESPKLPKLNTRVPFVLSTSQLSSYFKHVSKITEPSRTALLILPFCGLRVNELCKVSIGRIKTDFKDKSGNYWTVFLVKGKGNKSRVAPLLRPGAEILSDYLHLWRKNQRDSRWLFPGKNAKDRKVDSLSAKTLQAHLRHIRSRMNLPEPLTPHVLRKTCFTNLYRKGVSIQTIAWIAGHSSIEMTMKYYINVATEDVLSELDTAMKKGN